MTRIYCDVDGVLADLTTAVCHELDIDPDAVQWDGRYDMAEVFGCRKGRIDEVLHREGFWLTLCPFPGAVEFAASLAAIAPVTLITRSVGKACDQEKAQWLGGLFPEYPRIIEWEGEEARCRFAERDALLIDDCDQNIYEWIWCGREPARAILFPTRWNSGWQSYGNVGREGHRRQYAAVLKMAREWAKGVDNGHGA